MLKTPIEAYCQPALSRRLLARVIIRLSLSCGREDTALETWCEGAGGALEALSKHKSLVKAEGEGN